MKKALATLAVFACMTHATYGRAADSAGGKASAGSPGAPSGAANPGAPSGAANPAAPSGAANPASPASPASPISEEARSHFKAGVALLQDPDGARIEDAYREFRAAYEISASPKVLGNMGYCAMKLERDAEAIDAYSRYLREVPDVDADERAQIVRDLQTLTVGVVRVTVTVSEPTALFTDTRIPVRGDRITNVYTLEKGGKLTLGVRPGHHQFTARAAGFADATWEVDALAGAREQHDFVLSKIDTSSPRAGASGMVDTSTNAGGDKGSNGNGSGGSDGKRSNAYLIPLIAGGAALGVGTVTGIVALGKTNSIANACPANTCPRDYDLDGNRSSASTFVTATDFLLIGGGILAAGGAAWWYFTRTPEKQSSAPPSVGAFCARSGCMGSASVSF